MEEYNPRKIEEKWQKVWEEKDVFKALDKSKKPKFYLLVEFPYPSGDGLHVGHCRSYVALDILARKKRMAGFNVLFPMGWDAFGLPAENYAIKTGIHPVIATKQNSENFKRQQKMIGLSFDWLREINTSDTEYYKWTQWIFIQLFKNGLAYKGKMPINWCPSCKIGLANEEAVGGKCERCGAEVEKKEKEQWMLKITDYAERLINDLDLVDYPERVKISQKDWIGRSEGVEIIFKIYESDLRIPVFTTRPDTLFSCTYLALAPEHFLIEKLKDRILNYSEVQEFIKDLENKTSASAKAAADKAGIELKGIKATNPANNQKIPIFAANYVLAQYGAGAIMAVPAYDERDFDFAKKYNLPIIDNKLDNGIIDTLERKGLGAKKVNYKLRDWIFSRQRYWGEPIPLVFCENCAVKIKNQKSKIKNKEGINIGEILNPGWVAASENDLPVELPDIKDYKPTDKGESPLAKDKKWVETKCPKCKGTARRETDVMPNWAGSNWYYLAYTMPRNPKSQIPNSKQIQNSKFKIQNYVWDKNKIKQWLPVDWYNGGMEHTTLHLLYSRFIYKFLWDIGAAPKEIGPEPYKKRTSHGMVLGEGGIKMSKSKGNVINPDEVIKKYGADTMRIYEMFMGPFDQAISWDENGIIGARRFLERVWNLSRKLQIQNYKSQINPKSLPASATPARMTRVSVSGGLKPLQAGKIQNSKLDALAHKTIKKVGEDIEGLKLNTAVSALMILANEMDKEKEIPKNYYSQFLILLSPFAPHISEELWFESGFKGLCCQQEWPKYNPKLVKEEKINLVIQVNGKVRDRVEVVPGISEDEARKISEKSKKALKYLAGNKIKKIIFVPDKLVNFAIDKK